MNQQAICAKLQRGGSQALMYVKIVPKKSVY